MKTTSLSPLPADIDPLIVEVRGEKVIMDADLARIYGVPTKALNQAVKRNHERFPEDFLLRLTVAEAAVAQALRSQIVTSNEKRGGRRYLPYAFTEHGAIMAANIQWGTPFKVLTPFFSFQSLNGGFFGMCRMIFPAQPDAMKQCPRSE